MLKELNLRFLFILLLILVNTLPIRYNVSSVDYVDWIIENYSFRSSTGESVYPGSRNTQLTIIARYIDSYDAINPVACINLPEGFQYIESNCVPARDFGDNVTDIVKPGITVYFRFRINVDRSIEPGLYEALVNITYFKINDNNLYWEIFSVELEVSEYPPLDLKIVDSYFSPYNYPGARNVDIILIILNNGESSINSLRLNLILPVELVEPSEINYTYVLTIPTGREVYLSIGPVVINPYASPNTRYTGILRVYAQLSTSDNVVYSDERQYNITLSTGCSDVVKINVLTYELTSNTQLPGLRNTGLRILIQSLEDDLLNIKYSRVLLENAESVNGSNTVIYVHNIILNYLDVFWITYNGINIYENASYMRINTTIYGTMVRNNVEYPVSINLSFTIILINRDIEIYVKKIWWRDSIAYPGSTSNELIISIFNNETQLSIIDAVVELETFSNVIYPNNLTVYNIVLNSGSLTEIVYTDIAIPESTQPGLYEGVLKITGVLRCVDNSFKYITITRRIFILVTDYSNLEPVLPMFSIIDTYWGEVTPQYVYPGEAKAPLTIVLQNTGIVTVSNTLIVIESIEPSDVFPLGNSAICSLQLSPGSVCSATVYLDLRNSSSGLKTINIVVKYNLNIYNLNKVFVQKLKSSIYLPEYMPGGKVLVVDYRWLNNNPVYNGSRKVVLSITFSNLEAYTIGSIWVSLKTPRGVEIHSGYSRTIYVNGPVMSLQTATVYFTLDLLCFPGIYNATVEFDYYLQSNNGGIRKTSVDKISLIVENSTGSIEFVTYGWITPPRTPPVYGAQLYIILRNVGFPTLSNPVLKMKLPSGVVESRTNSSEPLLIPLAILTPQQLFINQITSNNIFQLLTQFVQSTPTSSVSKGDFLTFIVLLNIEENYTVLNIPCNLSFIDHWGEEYYVSLNLLIELLTVPPVLNIYPESPLIVFRNGTAFLDVVVENNYSVRVANVYVVLIPVSGNAIPINSLKYIEKLEGRSRVVVRFELVYNPVQIHVSSIPASFSSAVFQTTLIYTDVSGVIHSINTTLAVLVKPFIEIILLPEIVAKYSKGILSVNGIIANIGISTAKSTVIYLKYSNLETVYIIGDVEPSSQLPFRLEITTQYTSDKCTLVVKYRDEYGIEYLLTEELEIQRVFEESVTTTTVENRLDVLKYLVIVAIVCFLSGVFYVIHRYVKNTSKRMMYETS
ncbi:MAG: hypothetical protein QXW87_01325 [Desulfurococcaceae archaeon]